jgi:hypothetical protein
MILCSNAFAQDTTLVDVGTYDVNLGNGQHMLAINGDPDIYRDTLGVLKRGTWTPKEDTIGTYTLSVKEDLTIRASKNPAGYRVEKNGKYVEFWLMTAVFKRFNATTLEKIHRGFRWTIADGSYYQVNVSRGKIKETIYSIGKRNKFNVLINTNINRIGRVFDKFQILQLTAEDSTGKVLAIADSFIVRNDSTFFQALVDTVGAKFPIMVDPAVIIASDNSWAGRMVASKRDTAIANLGVAGTEGVYVGVRNGVPQYFRGSSKFSLDSLPEITYSVLSCTLFADGEGDASGTDFTISLAPAYNDTLDVAAYSEFHGRVVGNADNFKGLNTPRSTATYSASWNAMGFTAAGCDTIEKKLNLAVGSRNITFHWISSHDSANTTGHDDYIIFGASGDAGKEPYLKIIYNEGGSSSTQYAGRAMGRILNTPRGKELDATRNPGMIINEVYRKD